MHFVKVNFILLIFLIVSTSSFGDGSKRRDSFQNRKFLRKDIKEEPGKVFYLGEYLSLENFKLVKNIELKEFKGDLNSLYKLDFKVRYTKYYNIAYLCSEKEMDILEEKLNIFFNDTYSRYFIYEPRFTLRIVFFKNKSQFIKLTGYNSYGVYFPDSSDFFTSTERTLNTYYNSGAGTLWHEMIHSFVDLNTDKDIHQWFNEGFASFYEMGSTHKKKFIEGYTNWRLPELQKVIRNNKLTPLRIFLTNESMKEEFGYSQARFLFCYLWIENKIIPFVHSYIYELSPKYQGKELGEKTIEKIEEITGKNLDQIEKEYIILAKNLKVNEKLKQKK